MSTTITLTETQEVQRDAFVERLLQSTSGVFDIFSIYLGDRLGYYQALVDDCPLTSRELAARTGTQERYAREWLEQQTVAGILYVENPDDEAHERRFCLPAAYAEVLVDRESLNYLAPLAQLVAGVTRPLGSLLDAYRHGGGVPLSEYGTDFVEGQAGINRATFLRELGYKWLPAIPDLHARLQDDPPARVADLGTGAGWSSIGIAQAYPKAHVDGYDLDAPSVELARANARDAGLNGSEAGQNGSAADQPGRVAFHVRDASDPSLAGQYDLVTAFEAIHDMSDPVGALRTMRRLAKEDGVVLVIDERVGDTFTPTGNDVEWMMYGWSVLHCLPVGMVEHGAAGTGTVMRAPTLERYATEAGFSRVEILPIDNFFFRIYRLHV